MFRQDGSRRDFPLIDDVTTIGRRQDCSIRIPLSEVSRCHAEIRLSDHTVSIKDLGAANGTFLNTRRIKGEDDVTPGDQISIGPVVFTVQINGEPADGDMKTFASADQELSFVFLFKLSEWHDPMGNPLYVADRIYRVTSSDSTPREWTLLTTCR